LRESSAEIEETGARVVTTLCQNRDAVARYLERHPLPFPVVIDDDRSLARGWGVHHAFGIDAYNIARPATFVIDGEGTIRLAHVARTQFWSMGIDQILALLKTL
jgi:peroxiredoxin Q/BCP